MRGENFWDTIYVRLDAAVKKASDEKRKVGGLSVIWHLVVSPIAVFGKSLFSVSDRKGRIATLRGALHKSVFSFAVNARLYELGKSDSSELAKIKTEWNKKIPDVDL